MLGSVNAQARVEGCVKILCTAKLADVQKHIAQFVQRTCLTLSGGRAIPFGDDPYLKETLDSLRVCDSLETDIEVGGEQTFDVDVYRLISDGAYSEQAMDCDDGGEGDVVFDVLPLPNVELENVWESLVYDGRVKNDMLSYTETLLYFSTLGVDPTLVCCNRVVLLFGPPGTGKTSLCKGLAQKLAIRLGSRYDGVNLVEVNAHSLFSKWFSESGKMVMKMFSKIKDLASMPTHLCCVLIDEIESLVAARRAAASGAEPSDALRAVNAVLTQLDALRRQPNVLVFCTSNLTEAIDDAFLDRADVKMYIGPPEARARYAILCSSLEELLEKQALQAPMDPQAVQEHLTRATLACAGMSGRALRKLPLAAFALLGTRRAPPVGLFIDALIAAAERERQSRAALAGPAASGLVPTAD